MNEEKRRSRPLLVYLAEDDPALRTTIAALLIKDGHDVIEAEDGIQLMVDLSTRGAQRSDVLVVADVRMPMIGGLAVLRSLSRMQRHPPVILMTAFATRELREEAKTLGAIALFDKPFDLDDLRDVVRDVADHRDPTIRGARCLLH
jgi:two-component system, response regulator, stage 0 sporulation protein F